MSKRVCKDDQIRLIMECRQSGLSDYQWCKQNGIHPGNFYNWVSKLRKRRYSFPDYETKSNTVPNIQEVVKVDLIQPQDSSLKVDYSNPAAQGVQYINRLFEQERYSAFKNHTPEQRYAYRLEKEKPILDAFWK